MIDRSILVQGCNQCHGKGQAKRDHRGVDHQPHADRHSLDHEGQYRLFVEERLTEIAADKSFQEVQILHYQRLIKTELMPDYGNVFLGGGTRAEHLRRGITRDEPQHEKRDERDPEQDRHCLEKPASGIAKDVQRQYSCT